MANEKANVVLVHGGFVDGSGWLAVYDGLRRQGYQVTVVQNPTISLADDVAVWPILKCRGDSRHSAER